MKAENKGFTLVELLVVMGIIVLISAIAISSSFGMARGSAYAAAENIVFNSLQTARQHACTDGKRVVVAFMGDVEKYKDDALVIVEATGIVTHETNNGFIDHNATMPETRKENDDGSEGDSTWVEKSIWNLSKLTYAPKYQIIRKSVDEGAKPYDVPGTATSSDVPGEFYAEKYYFPFTQIKTTGTWKVDDAYGFQIAPMQKMPKGFKIGWNAIGTSPKAKLLVFEPDGTIGVASVGSSTIAKSDVTLFLYEEINKGNDEAPSKISISNGKIKKGKGKDNSK